MGLTIKLVGAALVVLSCGYAGLLVAYRFRARPVELRYLRVALQVLETEIAYAATPLPEVLGKLAGRFPAPVGLLWETTGRLLQDGRGRSMGEVWSISLDYFSRFSALTGEDLDILLQFGFDLGNSSKAEQVKNLRLTGEQLRLQEEKAEQERQKNERLWRALGFLGGLAVVFTIF